MLASNKPHIRVSEATEDICSGFFSKKNSQQHLTIHRFTSIAEDICKTSVSFGVFTSRETARSWVTVGLCHYQETIHTALLGH